MNVRVRLFLGFMVVVACIWGTVFFAMNTYSEIHQEVELLGEDVIPGALTMDDMALLTVEGRHDVMEYVLFGDEESKQNALAAMIELETVGMDHLAHEIRIGTEEQANAEQMVAEIDTFVLAATEMISLKEQGMSVDELLEMRDTTLDPAAETLVEHINKHRALHIAEVAESEEAVYEAHSSVVQVLLLLAGGITLLAAAVSFFIIRSIVRPIHALRRGIEIIGKGNLGHKVGTEAKDEIGQLSRAFDRMIRGLKAKTTSIASLEEEITERKRVEEELRRREEELKRRKDELEKTTHHLSTLQSITEVGLTRMGLEEMLRELLDRFVQGFGAVTGAIWIVDEKSGKLQAEAIQQPDLLGFSLKEFAVDITEYIVSEFVRLTTPLLLEGKDLYSLPINDKLKKDLKLAQITSMMLVPFTYQGEVIGIACCVWRKRYEFTPLEIGLLEVIADRAGTAIEFHRLNELTRQKSVALEEKNIKLKQADELKSDFLANMSHELRTPMNAIMGYTSLMLRERYGTVTEKQAEALWRVDRNAKNLLQLIGDILDISKIEAGKMPLHNEEVDLRELIEEVISTVEPMVREAKLVLETAVAEDTPALWTDRSKLKQIVLNLVSNAVKFTPKGGVTVSAWGSDGKVNVAVKDTGIGIREEDLKVIFEEFQQVDGSTTRDKVGTGLGLAISRKFANLLGGDIEVESIYGQGSTFTITIPYAAPP